MHLEISSAKWRPFCPGGRWVNTMGADVSDERRTRASTAMMWTYSSMDHILHVPNQWEMTLLCNVVPHWLGAYTKWSLLSCNISVSLPEGLMCEVFVFQCVRKYVRFCVQVTMRLVGYWDPHICLLNGPKVFRVLPLTGRRQAGAIP